MATLFGRSAPSVRPIDPVSPRDSSPASGQPVLGVLAPVMSGESAGLHVSRFPRGAFVTFLCLLVFGTSAWAAVPTRDFVPAQDGPTSVAQSVEIYRPGRVLVKLTDRAARDIRIQDPRFDKAVGPVGTGIESLDQQVVSLGLQGVTRMLQVEPRDQELVRRVGADRWFALDFSSEGDMEALAARLRSDPAVEDATVDYRAFPAAIPNDPLHPDHWGHNNTAQLPGLDWGGTYEHTLSTTVGTVGFDANAQPAWDGTQGYGSASVVIAIIDSGVDTGHPDLRLVSGYDYGDNDSNPMDDSAQPGHGTACAGIAAAIANNGLGSAGIAGGCSIMPLKVADSQGNMYFSAIVNAIYHAADNGADIISMSLGAAISSDANTDAALQYADSKGLTIFAATGNENASTISYPAVNQYVIGVGAASPCGERKRSSSSGSEVNPGVNTDPNGYTCDGERWWGSNYGVNSKDAAGAVDILAPTILPTTDIRGSGGYEPGDYSGFFNGTSCATPYAAGVAALVKSKNPSWTPAQIRSQLVDTAQDVTSVESGAGWDRYSGYGMIDAEAAVGGGGPATNPPVADFSGSPTSGFFPLTVSFVDASTNTPTSWSWNFGDGATSTAQNPSHTYTAAGSYTVSLTATNAYGSDTATKTAYITVSDPADLYATLPYSTGFESGALDQFWTTAEGVEGRIRVSTSYSPHGGSYQLLMDDAVSGGSYSQNEAWLHLNLSGESQVDLDFWWKEFGDETHAQDGVYFSDNGGSSFVKVYDLNGQSFTNQTWQNITIDLDQAAASAGLSLSSTFVVKFQQYDNYPMTSDGFAFDDISVTAGAGGSPPVADFAGTPTSGTAPLAVSFTDASTGATSWSWTFGDGATSTAQNPSHTYSAAGTYTVSLTVTNAFGSDTMTKNGYINVTSGGGGGTWVTITYDDFESGWGNYTDGGRDCSRYTGGTYAWQGIAAADIQDNSGTKSSFYHTSGQDVSAFTDLEVEFYFYPRSMETNEDFWVQYYDGSSWRTVASFARGVDFNNNTFYVATVNIPKASYNYPTNAKLRFRCDASGNADDVYIDAIEFRGLTASGSSADLANDDRTALPDRFALAQNYPNPFNPLTTIEFALPTATRVQIDVFDLRGRRVTRLLDGSLPAGRHSVKWDATGVASGAYFYRIEAGDFVQTRRMILVK